MATNIKRCPHDDGGSIGLVTLVPHITKGHEEIIESKGF